MENINTAPQITQDITTPQEEEKSIITPISRNEYLRQWRQDHPDYQKKWGESGNLSEKVQCTTCFGSFTKNYMYKHKKKHDSTKITPS